MALFFATIRRNSFYLSRFPIFTYGYISSCKISHISLLKRRYNCFSSHFRFLVIFFAIDLRFFCIVSGGCNQSSSVSFFIVFKLLNRFIDVSFNASKFFSSFFFDTYNLSMLSLRCKALKNIISFLFLWFMCLSSSQVHFKNGPEFLKRGRVQIFIPFI